MRPKSLSLPWLRLLVLAPFDGLVAASVAETVGNASSAQWFLVPKDDLGALEAFEYAIQRINGMRTQCHGFHLAPLMQQSYRAVEVYVKDLGVYSTFRLHLEPIHSHLAPGRLQVDVARQHSVTDLSLFQVTSVEPPPCDLYSALDDALLMVPWSGEAADHARRAAMDVLNSQREVLCPQQPLLEFIRVVAASAQPVEGTITRLVMEMREASTSFRTNSFVDAVSVAYALDQDVPSQCTVSPEIYPARHPCDMKYAEQEEAATGRMDTTADSGSNSSASARRLQLRPGFGGAGGSRQTSGTPTMPAQRRLLEDPADAAPPAKELARRFVDKGLDLPDDFDPRLQRTLCFPRGFSRRQGSCGSSWAFTATAVASFRECLWNLHTGQTANAGVRFLSVQELVSCIGDRGCSGGNGGDAFYYMKRHGVARESCSPYRARCFDDNSDISVSAADSRTSTPKSGRYQSSTKACPAKIDVKSSPCKCLPSVFHPTQVTPCSLLPNACPKVKIPHYFKLPGTADGNTVPQLERQMMQELLSAGPLYVSLLLWSDFYDPLAWTESGIYIHREGHLVGRHAATAVGWGTDLDSRDYWLLLNSFGNEWQQEGYFKVLRGVNSLELLAFGAWAVDWSHPGEDQSKPTITDVEVELSPVLGEDTDLAMSPGLSSVWLQISAFTDEPARMLARVQGLSTSVTGESKDKEFLSEHVLRIDLLKVGLLGDRAKLQLWASDKSQNTASWGPFTFEVPDKQTFMESQQMRRLSLSPDPMFALSLRGNASAAAGPQEAPPLWA